IQVPFTRSDLNNWKEDVKNLRRDPEGVARRFELTAKNLDIDWGDIDLMLSALSETERELVLQTARDRAELLQEPVDVVFPTSNPHWDPNNPRHYDLLLQYRRLIAQGLRRAIPKAVNWAALFEVRQGENETPTDFLE
ncbi:hypothetical protein N300_01472, partial [Calypte anna]